MDTQNVRILRFSILAKILGYHLKSPKSRFSPALKSDFLLCRWAEFLQGVFLGAKEALCKISANTSNKKLEIWHPKNRDFRTFSKIHQKWRKSKISKYSIFLLRFQIFIPEIEFSGRFWPIYVDLGAFLWKSHFGGFPPQEPTNHPSGWLLGLDPL